jgi:uncharacterized protein YbbC (DUF1343 family)
MPLAAGHNFLAAPGPPFVYFQIIEGCTMTRFGLDIVAAAFPKELAGRRIGLLCHAASITSTYKHAVDVFLSSPCTLSALFGPQHGMFGQTQDNMVEWEGCMHPALGIPVYSLYGESRKPSSRSLAGLDALVVDLQDVGARPYTYVWTVKLCMEACREAGIPLWLLDRPNPIAAVALDGPVLQNDFHSFVGGAPIPLCHRMTMGEMALLLKALYFPAADVHVVWMDGWWRNSLWPHTGLPWVLPSPNMPTFETAVVYPGMVLLEATTMSEGRGTTRPFEIVGAPYVNTDAVIGEVRRCGVAGCVVRPHDFIPTFQKWRGEYCRGFQVHVLDASVYEPVFATAVILAAVLKASNGKFAFKDPPYEYDAVHMPFDILAGGERLRRILESGGDLVAEKQSWHESYGAFKAAFAGIARYPEERE